MTTLGDSATKHKADAGSSDGTPTPGFQITILLMERGQGASQVDAATGEVLSSASAMVQDLLLAAEIPVTAFDIDEIVAKPEDIEAAVRLIRQIHPLLHGFSRDPAERLVYASILVDARPGAEASLAAVISHLRQKAFPGLVLFSHEAHQAAKGLPGLRFKQRTRQDGLSGGWELRSPEWLSATPHLPVSAQNASEGKEALLAVRPNDGNPLPTAAGWLSNTFGAGKPFRRWALPSGIAFAAVVALSIGIGLRGHGKTKAASPSAPAPVRATTVLPAPASTLPSAHPVPEVKRPAQPASVIGTAIPPRPVPTKSASEPAAEPQESVMQHIEGGASEEEIRLALAKAEKAAGNGEYDKAIGYYNYILKRNPHNAAALRGISRAKQNLEN